MNEIIVTLIASAFGTGGIAGIAALINLGGKRRVHKNLEQLSATEEFFEDDETIKNSLTASRRILAAEIATRFLIRNTLGRFLLLFVPLVAIYVYLFLVMMDWNRGFPDAEIYMTVLIVLIVFVVYTMTLQLIWIRGRRQRALQSKLLTQKLSVDEILRKSSFVRENQNESIIFGFPRRKRRSKNEN